MNKLFIGLLVSVFSIMFNFFVGNVTFAAGAADIGIDLSDDCTMGMGRGCFKLGKVLGIEEYQSGDLTAESIAQDIVLAATYMVGAVLTVVIIYCGLMYIFASRDGKDVNTYKKGLVSAAIGAVLVWGAYAIVRLIQYIAKG